VTWTSFALVVPGWLVWARAVIRPRISCSSGRATATSSQVRSRLESNAHMGEWPFVVIRALCCGTAGLCGLDVGALYQGLDHVADGVLLGEPVRGLLLVDLDARRLPGRPVTGH
jgi:hypothetical protein